MGTNYYAHWTPPAAPDVTIRLHICKSLVMFDGRTFATWRAWRDFLSHGTQVTESVKIVDEYGTEYEFGAFARAVETTNREARRRHFDNEAHAGRAAQSWLDPYGFSFHNGEFS